MSVDYEANKHLIGKEVEVMIDTQDRKWVKKTLAFSEEYGCFVTTTGWIVAEIREVG